MARIELENALKSPGRIMTWHAGGGCRSHKTSNRYDYYTVLPPDLASFLRLMDSDTMEPDVLELFLDEMLIDLLHAETEAKLSGNFNWQARENAVLFEVRGYFQGCLEFYVKQHLPPPTEPFRKRRDPRWLILASPHIRMFGQCAVAFDLLLDKCDAVARRHGLILDLKEVRDGFRTMLRRQAGYSASAVSDPFSYQV